MMRCSSTTRRGLSLLEVLISMFVLMIGLLGVAALIPAGRLVALQGAKISTSAAIAQTAFHDLSVRGYLDPTGERATGVVFDSSPTATFPGRGWLAAGATKPVWTGSTGTNAHKFMLNVGMGLAPTAKKEVAVVIDPLAVFSTDTKSPTLPHLGATNTMLPLNPLTRIAPTIPLTITSGSLPLTPGSAMSLQSAAVFDPVFRISDDLVLQPKAASSNAPPQQQMMFVENPPGTKNFVRRASDGNYSWIATLIGDSAVSPITVSVGVFYKRQVFSPGVGEYWATIAPITTAANVNKNADFKLTQFDQFSTTTYTIPPAHIRPGQWVLVSGMTPTPVKQYFFWCRVVAAGSYDSTNKQQMITVASDKWIANTTSAKVWIFDNLIAVYEQTMFLDLPAE